MRQLITPGLLLVALSATFLPAAETPQLPTPQKEHEWLGQLVGEWDYQARIHAEPDQPPVEVTGTETIRSIGGFWIQSEQKGLFGEMQFTGLMTLGYDTTTQQYVGTWIDSMSNYLWKYEGNVDKAGKILTLDTEGPCPNSPGGTSRFKEVIEIKGPDHKTFTSSIKGDDGHWTTMMEIQYRRRK